MAGLSILFTRKQKCFVDVHQIFENRHIWEIFRYMWHILAKMEKRLFVWTLPLTHLFVTLLFKMTAVGCDVGIFSFLSVGLKTMCTVHAYEGPVYIGRQLEEVRMSLGNTPLGQMQANKTGIFKETVQSLENLRNITVLGIKIFLL